MPPADIPTSKHLRRRHFLQKRRDIFVMEHAFS